MKGKFQLPPIYASLVTAILILFSIATCHAKSREIRSVIITGQNNHNWTTSHQAMKMMMEGSGLFRVDIALSPQKGEPMDGFTVDFHNYDLVVLDYNGDAWSESMKSNFVAYVEGGGGVVVYHAANNAFTSWDEYNQICGLGGWGGRKPKSGAYLYYEDGEIKRDPSAGKSGFHVKRHDFVITCRTPNHPITKGLPIEMLQCRDELYEKMRGAGNIEDLLYTAYSDPERGGSGRNEPLIFTLRYGKGRIFHTMLGHADKTVENSPTLQSTTFQVTLLRGAEWAATGKVKQPLPKSISSKGEVVYRRNYIEE